MLTRERRLFTFYLREGEKSVQSSEFIIGNVAHIGAPGTIYAVVCPRCAGLFPISEVMKLYERDLDLQARFECYAL